MDAGKFMHFWAKYDHSTYALFWLQTVWFENRHIL